jgi:WD40 repeat protein/mono/diheme cytochrome c family protein
VPSSLCQHRALLIVAGFVVFFSSSAGAAPSQPPVSFRRDIAPLFLKQCQDCHGPKKAKGGYRLDTFQHLLETGDSDKAPIVPGKAAESELFRLVSADDEDDRMPKKADPLPDAQVALIKRWIEQGASFDGTDKTAPLSSYTAAPEEPEAPKAYAQPIAITAIAFSPSGEQLAVSGYHEVTLWEPLTGQSVGRINRLPERTYGLAYSPDGISLAIACGTPGSLGEVRWVDLAHADQSKVLDRISDVMLAVRFSPDGTHLAAGGSDNAIRIYDVSTQRRRLLIEQHGDWITDLAFSPDSSRIVSASRDKSARVFDVKTGAMQAAFLGHGEAVLGVAWDPAGKLIYTAGHDRKVQIWNSTDGKKFSQITGFESDPFKIEVGLGFLFAGCADGIVRQYSLSNHEMEHAYPRLPEWVYCVAVDSNHRRIAAGSYGGQVKIWNIDDGSVAGEFVAAPGYRGKSPPTSKQATGR